METRILFCEDCVHRILNEKILSFWQSLCINRIVDNNIFDIGKDEQKFLDMANALEFMAYAITTDTDDGVVCKPKGIEQVSDYEFEICCCDEFNKKHRKKHSGRYQ